MCIITDCELAFNPRPLRTYRHRILYAGADLALLKRLRETLRDCRTVRTPDGADARLFIRSINYSLLLFDQQLPDTTGTELAEFTRALRHREQTPLILLSPGERVARSIETIKRLLARTRKEKGRLHEWRRPFC